ncbi:MAG: hypothetical protein V1743_04845 [Nanoarchaeota archaeon]
MNPKKALVVFEGKQIRRAWHNNQWHLAIEDIVSALTDSQDPKQYIQKMKQRDEPLAQGWVHIVHTLSIDTAGGKQKMNCVTIQGARTPKDLTRTRMQPMKEEVWQELRGKN